MFNASDLLKKASNIAYAYGFTPLPSLLGKRDINAKKNVKVSEKDKKETASFVDAKSKDIAAFFSQLATTNISISKERPLFVWHTNVSPGRKAPKVLTMQFHALGSVRPLTDAVVIRAMHALAKEMTKNESVSVRINSMGDKETRGRFTREMQSFFRKNMNTLPGHCVASARHDVFEAVDMLLNEEHEYPIPSPTDFLSEQSRKHFESVLEYLEDTGSTYELSPTFLPKNTLWSETCFEIDAHKGLRIWGSRHTEYAKQFLPQSTPGSVAFVEADIVDTETPIEPIKTRVTPRFVFVHIGEEAKRESLRVVDDLRKTRIPVFLTLGIESLTEQMRVVEETRAPYVLIMGRKEALDKTVIVRDTQSQNESLIPLSGLSERLKTFA